MTGRTQELRRRVLELVSEYYGQAFSEQPFVPGSTPVPVSGRVFDDQELRVLVDSALEFWLTSGRFAAE
ncbi:MAG TPA: lipopolysaccharide biosynthesis protein RfbH, partial [Terriglobales bacterium]|nr:lipopolysaccharide biosynthesis protein RfbH [Terriglobales bacterium]